MRKYAEQKGFQNDDDSQSVAYTPNVQAMEKRLSDLEVKILTKIFLFPDNKVISDLEVRIKRLETALNGMI